MLLEKAKNRTITYDESIELQNMLQQEARNAQAAGDFKFLIIMHACMLFLCHLLPINKVVQLFCHEVSCLIPSFLAVS